MKDIDLSTKKKIIILASLGLSCWGIVAWPFITRPLFMLDILPDFIPMAMFTFLVFLIGLLFLTLVGNLTVRAIAPRYAWLMICASAPLIVGFNHTSQPFFYSEPPTMVSVFQSCSVTGNNGWCKGFASLQLAASDPQGYTLTISGMIGDIPFTCPVGPTCGVPLPEGSGTITYQVKASTSGLSSLTGTTTWKRDVTPPTVTPLVSSPNGLDGWHIEMSSVPVSMTALDLVSGVSPTNGMEMSYDAGPWKTENLSVSEEGVHLIKFRATDNAGNVSPYEVRSIKLDKQGPTITFDVFGALGKEGWYISQPTTNILLDDIVSGVERFEWRYNGGDWEYAENWQESLIQSDGYHWLEVRAWDLAGNMSTDNITIPVDTARPDFYPSYPTPNSQGWIVTAASVSVSGDDPGAGYYGSGLASALVSVNGGEWQDSAVLPDGEFTVVFRVEDMAGNSRTMTRNFKVDRTAPDLSFSTSGTPGNPGWYLSQAETSILYDDDTSGIDHVEYRQNGSSWQNTGTILSMDGVNTIEARVYDLAGNVTNETLTIKVDTIAPTLNPVIPSVNGLNGWIISPSTSASVNGSDSGSGLESARVSVDDGPWQS